LRGLASDLAEELGDRGEFLEMVVCAARKLLVGRDSTSSRVGLTSPEFARVERLGTTSSLNELWRDRS
jgi:hypothetical protein